MIPTWPGQSTTCHLWVWTKGVDHVPYVEMTRDVSIMGVDRGGPSHMRRLGWLRNGVYHGIPGIPQYMFFFFFFNGFDE